MTHTLWAVKKNSRASPTLKTKPLALLAINRALDKK
jgi:hypothetical protein